MASACAHHVVPIHVLHVSDYIEEALSDLQLHKLNSAIAIIRLDLLPAAISFSRSRSVKMGNHGSSATPYITPQYSHVVTVVVGIAEGEGMVVEVEVDQGSSPATMKVGELLLEFSPGHFVAHFSRSCFPFLLLHSAATATSPSSAAPPRLLERASALGADADAMAGAANVYVLLPMPRLNTRLSSQERLTIARLLHNHSSMSHVPTTQAEHQSLMEGNHVAIMFAPAQLLRRLVKKRSRGAARIAPLHDDMAETQLADEEKEQELQLPSHKQFPQVIIRMPKLPVVMMKAKPWAPKLETISEDQQEGRAI
ncbi:hypothetical protein L7F22_008950 [Adiantum nelumboides]|nr:hypothetical protein [Adiantum nelumboides]